MSVPLAWRRAGLVCESSPSTAMEQLDWLASTHNPRSLHPPGQAQAPAMQPDCSVPGQPNFARPPASTWSTGLRVAVHELRRRCTYLRPACSHPATIRQSAANQQIINSSLLCQPASPRLIQANLQGPPGLVCYFRDGLSAACPAEAIHGRSPRLD